MFGRPSVSQNDEVTNQIWTVIIENCHITISELVDEVRISIWISIGLVHSNLTEDLVMWRASAKFVPRSDTF